MSNRTWSPPHRGFVPIRIKAKQWWDGRNPRYVGTWVLWRDGTAHQVPEDSAEVITVLVRRPHRSRAYNSTLIQRVVTP